MSSIIEKSFNNLVNGKVFEDFKNLPYEGQKRVVVKTALVAAAVGILTGLIAGTLPAVIIAGIVGIAAFSYFVTRYATSDYVNDIMRAGVRKMTRQNDVIDDIIDGTVELYHKAEQKIAELIKDKPA